jgi:hypothetical protein
MSGNRNSGFAVAEAEVTLNFERARLRAFLQARNMDPNFMQIILQQ